jgi:hypothetical protein
MDDDTTSQPEGQPLVGIYKNKATGDLFELNGKGIWRWLSGSGVQTIDFKEMVRVDDTFEQLGYEL